MVLVTGATGLLGSHLLYFLLIEGKEVKALVRDLGNVKKIKSVFSYYNAEHLFDKIKFAEGDVCDFFSIVEALIDVKQVYHCAALVSFDDDDYALLYKANVEGTANVVNACLEKQIKLCHVSSVAALGEAKENNLVNEKDSWTSSNKKSAYSITKFNAEREVWRGIEEGLDAFIINPTLIIGPGNWGSSSSNMIISAYKGMRFIMPGITGFVDVRDVAQLAIKLMDKDVKKERYILSENNHSFVDFYKHASKSFEKKAPSLFVSRTLVNIGVQFLNFTKLFGNKPQITASGVASAFNKKYFDNAKVLKLTGWKFIPLNESVAFACEKYLQEIKQN
ncbi:MAG: NAD-dependent epimerase/dehydratase family protein [Bacteroidota bacterium]